jgi:hypothetical protein
VTGEAVRKWEAGRSPDRPTALALDETLELGGVLLDRLGYAAEPGTVTLEGVDAKLDDVRRAIAHGIGELTNLLRLVHLMETRQRRAFDLMHLDATVDLDDSRLDDPEYRAEFAPRPLPVEDPSGPVVAPRRRHRAGK